MRFLLMVALFAGLGMFASHQTWSSSPRVGPVYGEPLLASDVSATANWSGYAASGDAGAFDGVKASWTQPSVKCPTLAAQYALYWIGIDGFNSSTVEQIGTGAQCKNGAPVYFAWYEFYPSPSKRIMTLPAKPGDHFSARISSSGTVFTMELTNNTTGGSFKVQEDVPAASKSSAEWIAEAPSLGEDIQVLTNFGSVTFTAASATSGGKTYPIRSSAWDWVPLSLSDEQGRVNAEPSQLSSNGGSFKVVWSRR